MTTTGAPPIKVYPFFDPIRDGRQLSWGLKIGIALGIGGLYFLLQYTALRDKTIFFQLYCWILGVIISTAILALYMSTEIFRRSLVTINELEAGQSTSQAIVTNWLSNKWYVVAGLVLATANTSVGHVLGVPPEYYVSSFSLAAIYAGIFAAWFAAGMGLLGILAIIVLYLRFAPNLQHTLDPLSPDGIGGIKKLGDSLWFFGGLI